jgi:transglutaminase-like putative cysteine protease
VRGWRPRLHVSPEADLRWQQDPYGNRVARIAFRRDTRVETLEIQVELTLEIRPINPFDFLLDKIAETVPIPYSPELRDALAPFLVRQTAQFEEGPRFREFHAALPATGPTAQLLTTLNREVNRRVRYVVRDEPGVWTPENTPSARGQPARSGPLRWPAGTASRGRAPVRATPPAAEQEASR